MVYLPSSAERPTIQLSQSALSLLDQCPRKFQHTYLDQLQAPMSADHQTRLEWGKRFHHLMQQHELGLPLPTPPAAEADLYQAVQQLVHTARHLFLPRSPTQFRQSEHQRGLVMQGYALVVIYDLVILEPPQGTIVDWKTYPRPTDRDRLLHHWQTRLYPFVLAETSDCDPDRITMTYWFTQGNAASPAAHPPQSYEFPYSRDRHEQIRQTLTQQLSQLDVWLAGYAQGEPFPQLPLGSRRCETCEYAARCDRLPGQASGTPATDPLSLDWDDIAEVPI